MVTHEFLHSETSDIAIFEWLLKLLQQKWQRRKKCKIEIRINPDFASSDETWSTGFGGMRGA